MLVALVSLLYYPVLGFEFVNMDVTSHVHQNQYVHEVSWENLVHICTRPCPTSYYPVRSLTYMIDCQVWGLNPAGFKLSNAILHLANTLILFGLLLRLLGHRPGVERSLSATAATADNAWIAGAGAALFAVHPVAVEAVAWVPAREELLMTTGALVCFHFHITAGWRAALDQPVLRTWYFHLAAAVACAAACLSNAVGAVVPMLIIAWDLLFLPRQTWKRMAYGTIPMWIAAAGTIVLKSLIDVQNPYALDQQIPLWRNLLTIPKVFWLNLKSLFWPTELAFDYWDSIPASVTELPVVLGILAVLIVVLLLWRIQKDKRSLFGIVWVILALGPTSQILPHHILRADRFLYLPAAGLAVTLTMILRRVLAGRMDESGSQQSGHSAKSQRHIAATVVVILLLTLSLLSRQQLQTWRNSITVWDQCLRLHPNNAVALAGLADAMSDVGRFEQAIPKFEESLRIAPNAATMNSYAYRLAMSSNRQLRNYARAIDLSWRANEIVHWRSDSFRRTLSIAHMNLATDLEATGRSEEAIRHFRAAIKADPTYEAARFNLALTLASSTDERFRDVEEAIRVAEEACRATERPRSLHLSILASVYELAGRTDRAIAVTEQAIQRAKADGDDEVIDSLQDQLHRLSQ